MLILMLYGYPVSGKTFISEKLNSFLAKDYKVTTIATLDFRIKFNLFNLGSEDERNRVYGLLVKHVERVVEKQQQDICIIDGNFNKSERRKKLYSVINNNDVLYIIKCVVDDESVIRERLAQRQKKSYKYENKAATIELYNMIRKAGDPVENDGTLESGNVGFVQFNSNKNIVEKVYRHTEGTDIKQKRIIDSILNFLNSGGI